MDKTSIVVYTEQDMIMILQKKKKKKGKKSSRSNPRLTDQLLNRQKRSIPHFSIRMRHQIHHTRFCSEFRHISIQKKSESKKKKTRGEVKRKHNMIDSLLSTIVVLDILTDIIRCNG